MTALSKFGFPIARSEFTKFFTVPWTWILGAVAVLGTWPMAWANAASGINVAPNDPRLFSAAPIPLEYQGFDLSGFGLVLVIALAAMWGGSEYAAGKQIRTTLLATPQRFRIFVTKTLLLAIVVALIAFLTMWGTLIITHGAGATGVNPWAFTQAIWGHLGGVTIAWVLVAVITFAVAVLTRTPTVPLLLLVPLVIGLGDFLAGFWGGAKYLPIAAGVAMYTDPVSGIYLDPMAGGLVEATWAVVLLFLAELTFVRRDV